MKVPFDFDKDGNCRTYIYVDETDSGLLYGVLPNTWMPDLINHGWGNGYVFIPFYHEYYGASLDSDINLEVHGGITYEEFHDIDGMKYKVIGFDSSHHGDNDINRPIEWVVDETLRLLEQVDKPALFGEVGRRYKNLKKIYGKDAHFSDGKP
jgi:hypothetical protein